jgi:hypothetical protein
MRMTVPQLLLSRAWSRAARSLTGAPSHPTLLHTRAQLLPQPISIGRAFATLERRHALLAAAGAFDGELGVMMSSFTQQVTSACPAAISNTVTILQHARECSAAEITEMERMMRLTADELNVRGCLFVACQSLCDLSQVLISRPGSDISRLPLCLDNGMLQRFLSHARFLGGAGEFK